MKKFTCVIIVLLILCSSFTSVQAQTSNKHKHDSKGPEQALDHFMLELFGDEIRNAVTKQYNDDSIFVSYDWWNKDYDVVEIDQSEKGHKLENSYVVKFTVKPGNKGTDTITFGVEPPRNNEKLEINLLRYEHKAPLKR